MATVMTSKAKAIATRAGLSSQFDVTTIISIITSIFQALSNCNPTPAQIHKSITRPGLLQRRAMKNAIREEIDNPALRPHIEDAILQVGASSSEADTTALYHEAVGTPPG